LGAGINVICHGSESYFPQGADPDLAEKIDALAKRNAVTSPGLAFGISPASGREC
jgi:hypothetical protein